MLGCAVVERTENLVLGILRRMQSDIAEMRGDIRDIKGQLIDTLTHILAMETPALRQERAIADLQVKLDRIEARLTSADRR